MGLSTVITKHILMSRTLSLYVRIMVENSGIEPLTSCMPCKPRTHAPPHKGARVDDIWRLHVLFQERHILTKNQHHNRTVFY